MMELVYRVDGIKANPNKGNVIYDYPKLFWNLGMISSAILFIPFYFSLEGVLVFLLLTYLSLLIGHSVGMHRMHDSSNI